MACHHSVGHSQLLQKTVLHSKKGLDRALPPPLPPLLQWSNVVCVPRTHPIYPWMEQNSLRHELFKLEYYASTAAAGQAAA